MPQQALVMEAALAGTFSIDDGCVAVVRGSEPINLVWSGVPRVEAGPAATIVFQGVRLVAGARISVGGGFVDPAAQPDLAMQISDGPCRGRFFLVQTVQG